MTFESLAEIVFNEMKNKIESDPGLSIFASERAKFEGWVKMEGYSEYLALFEQSTALVMSGYL